MVMAILMIFSVILQTVVSVRMLSIRRQGRSTGVIILLHYSPLNSQLSDQNL